MLSGEDFLWQHSRGSITQTLDRPSIEEKHGGCMYIGNRTSDALHFLNVEALKPFKVLLYLNFQVRNADASQFTVSA
jgi:hypothetical protein